MTRENEFRAERLGKAEKLRELGVDPFGGRFADVTSTAAVRERAATLPLEAGVVLETERTRVAGRIVLHRVMGNLVFLTVRDATGDLQFGLSKKSLRESWPAIKLLDLGEWYETSDYGRRIAKDWQDTVERAQRELRLLQERLSYAGTGSGDPIEILGNRIKIHEKFLRWQDRCPPCTQGMPPKKEIQRKISEMRRDLAKMKRRRRY